MQTNIWFIYLHIGPIYALRQPAFAYNLLKAFFRRIKGSYGLRFIMYSSFAEMFVGMSLGIYSLFSAKGLLGSSSCRSFLRSYRFIFAPCITILLSWTPLGGCSKSNSLYRLNCADFAWILVVVISSPLPSSKSVNKTFSSFCQSSTIMNSTSALLRVL